MNARFNPATHAIGAVVVMARTLCAFAVLFAAELLMGGSLEPTGEEWVDA